MKEKLFTRQYIGVIALQFFLSVSLNMSGTLAPLYAQYLGGSFATLGLVMAFFTAAALLFRPFFGMLLDSKGRKLVLIGGGIVFIFATLSYTMAWSVAFFLLLRFVHGFGFSAHSTASGTIVADIVPRSRLNEGVGYFGIAHTVSMAVGPVIGLSILDNFGFVPVFVLASVIAAISILIAIFTDIKDSNSFRVNGHPVARTFTDTIIEKTVVPTSVILFFIALTFGAILTFLPAYGKSLGIADIGIFFTVFALVQLVVRPLTGMLADKFGFSYAVLPGFVFLAASMLILAYSTNILMFILAGFAYGIGFGSIQPSLNAIMIKLCPPDRRGVGNATFFSAMDIGIGAGAVLWGIVSELTSFRHVYIICSICVIAAGALYLIWLNNKVSRKDDEVLVQH